MAEKEYIERDALKERLKDFSEWCRDGRKQGVDFVLDCSLPNMPAADVVEVRHGEWVEGAEHFTNGFYEAECSVCGNYIRWNEGNSGEWNYCPNCGAKMDGGKTE